MNLADAKAMLSEIRLIMETIGEEWQESYDLDAISTQVCEINPSTREVYPLATFEKSIPSDARELIRKAPVYVRALLLLRDAAVDEYRKIAPRPAEPKKKQRTPANICAIMCHRDGAFRRWLVEGHGLHDASDAERIKTHVRFLLKVQSLSEIDTDPDAGTRWKKLRGDFDAWMRSGR